MKIGKLFSRLVSVSLVGCMLFCNQPWTQVAAEEVQDRELATQYISDVKMFYGVEESQAKRLCESEGYIFCPQDLKEGSDAFIHAYMGYKKTEDRDEAITDISLLDMKSSAYKEMRYEEYLDKYLDEYADQANQVMILVNEYRNKYAAGSTGALVAYDSLNSIYVDKARSHTDPRNLLGDYLLRNGDVTFFEKFMQRGNAVVYSGIVDHLSIAAADDSADGTTWLDRAKTSEIEELYANGDSAMRNQFNSWYQDAAKELIAQIGTFAATYREAQPLYDEYGNTFGYDLSDMTDESSLEDLMHLHPGCRIPEYLHSIETYELLCSIPYDADGAATLADLFFSIADDPEITLFPEKVYPLLDGMTTAQRTVLSLCGIDRLIVTLLPMEDYDAQRASAVSETAHKLEELGFEDGKIDLWACADIDEYSLKVAETEDVIKARNGGMDLIEDVNMQLRKETSSLTMGIKIADISILAVSGIAMVAQAIAGTSLWAAGCAAIEAGYGLLEFGFAFTTLAGLTMAGGVILCALYVLNIVALVASLVLMVYMIMDACGAFEKDPERTDYSTVPDRVYHIRSNMSGNYRVRYDAVPGNYYEWLHDLSEDISEYDERTRARIAAFKMSDIFSGIEEALPGAKKKAKAELGTYLGKFDRWIVMYASKSPNAGKPIEVAADGSFYTTEHTPLAPDGYRSVSLMSGTQAVDVNDIDMDLAADDKTPLFMFIPGTAGAMTSATVTESDQYVTKAWIAHSAKKQTAIDELQNSGLELIQINLTPYDGYTFIGYQLGSEANALTDLRVSTIGTEQIKFGAADYAKAGLDTSDRTPDGLSLYATMSPAAGTPIAKISVETKRLPLGSGAEPVCLFSGGQAVDFKHKWSDNAGYDYFAVQDNWHQGLWENKSDRSAQDDPVDGLYLYFWPKEQYKAETEDSQPPYVAGFSYFMAVDKGGEDQRFGSNQTFMKTFAKENGFELVEGLNTISDDAGTLKVATFWQDKEGGMLKKDWTYDVFHSIYGGMALNSSDEALINGGDGYWMKHFMKDTPGPFRSEIYFGVSYTYNPYRAVTGISGLIAPYTEKTSTLRYSGLTTPAGTMQVSNVSIQGNPITAAGVCNSYYNMANMIMPFYVDYGARQRHDLTWMTDGETEVMTHYLLTNGPVTGLLPIRRDEIMLVTEKDPGTFADYVPVCDLRTPGDYEHPLNLALDTTNEGSAYLYLYLRNDAGGRVGEDDTCHNVYTKKHYVAGVFCGTGDTPEAAINALYAQAAAQWDTLAAMYPDISDKPLVAEFDEILPIDLSDADPWYKMGVRGVSHRDPSDNEWVYGNDLANMRWGHRASERGHHFTAVDEFERGHNCAYIGVVRTNQTAVSPVYALLKYYTSEKTAPATLSIGGTVCSLAGGPVKSKEGSYFLYFSRNSGTATFCAPVTEIEISKEQAISGYNTTYSCSDKDKVDFKFPSYDQLRMRTDEFLYIHTKFDLADLPYIESLYIGVGKDRASAIADLFGTSNACADTTVNCNYNSASDTYIAIGYRRTANAANAIRDVFLYVGDAPPEQLRFEEAYTKSGASFKRYQSKDKKLDENGNVVMKGKLPVYETTYGAPYQLLKHNLKEGSEILSLNAGSGGPGIYLYYTRAKDLYYAQSSDAELAPIRNFAFTYGDISPLYATAEDLANAYSNALHGRTSIDAEAYQDVHWENVLAVEDASPSAYQLNGANGIPLSLNYGVLPGRGNDYHHTVGDTKVRMYIDRGASSGRDSAQLTQEGYYSATTTFGTLHIDK